MNNNIKSLYISERIHRNLSESQTEYTSRWFNRKSLLSKEDWNTLIKIKYGNMEYFNRGIGKLKKNTSSHNLETLTPWVLEFQTYLDEFEERHDYKDNKKIDYSVRFLIQGVKDKIGRIIESNKRFKFENEFFINIIDAYISEIMFILNQTIISDLHVYKKNNILKGNDEYSRFQSYLTIRFGEKEDIKNFFTSYPYAIRIIMTRTKYFISNIEEIMSNLNDEFIKFKETLNINSSIISSIDLSMGDTHDHGKSVSIIHFKDGNRVVYKPKKLEIAKKVNDFMLYLNQKIGSDFYTTKRLVKENYSFEEYIDQCNLESLNDAENYYSNYGELMGLAYILNGSDFHYENIIAHKQHPIIIDMETFLHEPSPLIQKEKMKNVVRDYISESVIGSSMIPVKIMKERSENQLEGIDLSGLSHGRVDIPFNVLVIKNPDTDEIKYEWDRTFADECKNVPTHDDKIIPYHSYKNDIYKGFVRFLNSIMENKCVVKAYILEHFSNLHVRQIVRPTQKYADLLRYSYHPSCLGDAIEREKVLHNLWAYSLSDKKITMFEFDEMLNGDIPQFFTNTSERSIYSNNGYEFRDIYAETPLDVILRKIEDINAKTIQQQLNIIKSSFQDFKFQEYVRPIDNGKAILDRDQSILKIISDINETLVDNMIISDEDEILTYLEINDGFETELLSLSEGLYNGLAGIFLFLTVSDYINRSDKNKKYREYIVNSIVKNSTLIKVNAFFGKGSLIYPLIVEYELFKEKKSLKLAESLAKEVMQQEISKDNDWIYGSLSLVPIFKTLTDLTKNEDYFNYARKISESIIIKPDNEFIGFAHGDSSIYYINKYVNYFDKDSINNILLEEERYLEGKKWRSEKIEKRYFSGWCKGDMGIEMARLISFDEFNKNQKDRCIENINIKNNNTLCHGNSSLLELLIQMKKKDIMSQNQYDVAVNNIINNIINIKEQHDRFNVYSGIYGEALGLFTGISGLGYQLARLLDRKIPNVLFFEPPSIDK